MIHCFEIVCEHFRFSSSTNVFFSLFVLIQPGPAWVTQQWVSFRACLGRKIFTLYEESYEEFKWSYFKVVNRLGVHPFFLTLEGEPQIDIYWRKNFSGFWVSNMSSVEREMLEFFLRCWGVNR